MAKYKIQVDREECIGDELCCSEAPCTFEMDDDGIATVINAEGDTPDCIRTAAESCPVDAITLHDAESGEKVYPEE